MDCDTNALAEAAKCFKCLPGSTQLEVQTYLLAILAGASLDPNVLQSAAKDFQRLSPASLIEVQTYLLCQLLNA